MTFLFDPYSREVDSDPFPLYKVLRDEHPCYWSETGDCWVITRHADIGECNKNWEIFSSAQGNMLDDLPERAGSTLGTTDPPRHDRMRMLIQAAFGRRNVDYLTDPIRDLANSCIDKFIDKGEAEFITDFSSPVTIGTLARLLGIPADDSKTVRSHVLNILQTNPDTRKKTQEALDSFEWLKEYTQDQLNSRMANPGEDLLTALIDAEIDGEKLLEQEILMTSLTLIMAGLESGSSFMTMLALNLHDAPDARKKINDDNSLLSQTIEESLRFNTSAQRFRRTLTQDYELHGETMRAGDKVLMCYGAGNRDERKFPNPDVYDIARKPTQHLGFGTGKHNCIGTALARLMVRTAVGTFLDRVPNYSQAEDKLGWIASTTFRSPSAFPIKF